MRKNCSTWEKAQKFGVDTTLIDANLRKTPTERVQALQGALALADKLRLAGAGYYAKLRKTH